MTNASDFEGLLSVVIVAICTCVHIRRAHALREWFLSGGPHAFVTRGIKKTSVIALKLQTPIAIICLALSVIVLIK